MGTGAAAGMGGLLSGISGGRSLALLNPFFAAGSCFAVNSGPWQIPQCIEGVQEHVNDR